MTMHRSCRDDKVLKLDVDVSLRDCMHAIAISFRGADSFASCEREAGFSDTESDKNRLQVLQYPDSDDSSPHRYAYVVVWDEHWGLAEKP